MTALDAVRVPHARGGLPGVELRVSTLARLALAGTGGDRLRVTLTAASAALATLALLAAATVAAIEPPDLGGAGVDGLSHQYTNALLREPGLRPGVALVVLLLTLPVLALAGQCARIGAPARDRRLAAIRLAGGTPRQAVALAVVETGGAALLGVLAGVAVQLAARPLLHRPDARGRLPLPTDVLPSPAAYVAVLLGVPLLSMLAAAVLLRRVTATPFGVRRSATRRAPRPWPAALIVLGVGGHLALLPRVVGGGGASMVPFLMLPASALAILGVVLGVGWISATTGRLLLRFSRRPASLIAARDLIADPWHGSRTLGALLAAVLLGSGALVVRAWFVTTAEAHEAADAAYRELGGRPEGYLSFDEDFYVNSAELFALATLVALAVAAGGLLVALLERVFARRRAHSALLATGVPRGVLIRALAWRTLTPAVPAIALAVLIGAMLARGYAGDEVVVDGTLVEACEGAPPRCTAEVVSPDTVRPIDLPVVPLALLGTGALALITINLGVAARSVRTSATPGELRTP